MAAYKKIQGNPIKPVGGKPSGKMFDGGVIGQPKSGISIKTTQPKGFVSGKGYFMGSQASGPETVQEARGKHLA